MAEPNALSGLVNALVATGSWLFANRADLIGIVGLLLTMLAYREARAAKQAAHKAGQIIKRQTANIELTELSQELATLDPQIDFGAARNLLNRITGKVARLIEPYRTDPQLRDHCETLEKSLKKAEQALASVWSDPASEFPVGNMVYQVINGPFAEVRTELARFLGRFDSDSTEVRS